MNPTQVSQDASISKFTFALLEDTNWYKVINWDAFDPVNWGKGKGCDFFENGCYSQTKNYSEFYFRKEEYSCGYGNGGLSGWTVNPFTDECKVYELY